MNLRENPKFNKALIGVLAVGSTLLLPSIEAANIKTTKTESKMPISKDVTIFNSSVILKKPDGDVKL